MAEPTRLKGRKHVDVRLADIAEILSEVKRLRHHEKMKEHMEEHTVSIAPATVNKFKDYIANAGLDDKSEILKKVVNASGANCPDPDHCQF